MQTHINMTGKNYTKAGIIKRGGKKMKKKEKVYILKKNKKELRRRKLRCKLWNTKNYLKN